MKTSIVVVTVVLVIALGFCPVVQGAGHIEVASVEGTAGPAAFYSWNNLINDSGMSGDTRTLADTHDSVGTNMGLTNNYPQANLVFDLGTDYKISEMWIWNYSDHGPTTVFGMKNVQIYYKADGDPCGPTPLEYIEIPKHDGTSASPVSIIVDFNDVTARYVYFNTEAFPNHNWSGGQYNFCGLGEVRFYTDAITDCGQAIGFGYGLAGDVNGDCYVNFEDYADFARTWFDCMDPENPICNHPWLP
ncbi:MAG: hypothetical protein A2Y13_00670 [Planctomycetes bacterium GWC2_45_44]|nr:MAG: hypothetical protein A2Y13_00670 [Planctomycetes bacterium GWC2_45_44]HBR19001.1 hypothetical protein [Phycisphaerales bacterium]